MWASMTRNPPAADPQTHSLSNRHCAEEQTLFGRPGWLLFLHFQRASERCALRELDHIAIRVGNQRDASRRAKGRGSQYFASSVLDQMRMLAIDLEHLKGDAAPAPSFQSRTGGLASRIIDQKNRVAGYE